MKKMDLAMRGLNNLGSDAKTEIWAIWRPYMQKLQATPQDKGREVLSTIWPNLSSEIKTSITKFKNNP